MAAGKTQGLCPLQLPPAGPATLRSGWAQAPASEPRQRLFMHFSCDHMELSDSTVENSNRLGSWPLELATWVHGYQDIPGPLSGGSWDTVGPAPGSGCPVLPMPSEQKCDLVVGPGPPVSQSKPWLVLGANKNPYLVPPTSPAPGEPQAAQSQHPRAREAGEHRSQGGRERVE